LSIDIAERNGSAFRRRLRSAERLSDRAIARGSCSENSPLSRSRASLVRVTRRDQRLVFFLGVRIFFEAGIMYFRLLSEKLSGTCSKFHHDGRC
jgi:hypothetical protein